MKVLVKCCLAYALYISLHLGVPEVLAQGEPVLCAHHRRSLLQRPRPIDDCDTDPNPPPSCKNRNAACTNVAQCCSSYLCAKPAPFTSGSSTCTSVNCDDAILYNLNKVSEWMSEAGAGKYTQAGYSLVRSRASQLQPCTRTKSPKSAADKMQQIDQAFEGSGAYPYDRFDYTNSAWQPIGNPLFGFAIAAAYKVPLNEGVSCMGFGKERLCQGNTCSRSGIATPAYLVADSGSPYERWSTTEGRQYMETTSNSDMHFWYKKSGWSFRKWVKRKSVWGAACVFMSG